MLEVHKLELRFTVSVTFRERENMLFAYTDYFKNPQTCRVNAVLYKVQLENKRPTISGE